MQQSPLGTGAPNNLSILCYFEFERRPIFSILLVGMHPKEREIREVATKAPFVAFTVVTASGERYNVPTPDHIFFFPDADEDGVLQTEEERAQCFMVFGKGVRYRLLFFDTITAIDMGGTPNAVARQ